MSGTSGSLTQSSGGVVIPPPKVNIMTTALRPAVFVSKGQPSAGGTEQVEPLRYVRVTTPGISQTILDDLAGYAPQVELLRYTGKNGREGGRGGNGGKASDFAHPSHGPSGVGGTFANGSFTHGGVHGGVDTSVRAIRPTEWAITGPHNSIDVTQGMLGFMCHMPVGYRDLASTPGITLPAIVPSYALSRGRGTYVRFPYEKMLSGGYFAFRISIRDLSDSRGKRVWGPYSEMIQCANTLFPFVPDGVDGSNATCALPHPRYISDPALASRAVNFWTVTRLP